MRTTLDIDEDVLQAVKEISRRQKRTAGAVLSDLARDGLKGNMRNPGVGDSFLGFEPIPPDGHIVTRELVEQLIDEDEL